MHRIPEPELMLDLDQARAYAGANFEVPHQRFIELLSARLPALPRAGTALDLGCGPADIACRFARAYPAWHVHGLDASPAMLAQGGKALATAELGGRVSLYECHLPGGAAPLALYELVFSNSLLHHLDDPLVLWQSVKRWSQKGGPVFVMDLSRPATPADVERLVHQHSEGEPEVLRRDFGNSLFAAYRPEEVRLQLEQVGLGHLRLEIVSDRHFVVWGA
jgi:ubiquinone/menaquinone biosynthesis C-methylase UbiE